VFRPMASFLDFLAAPHGMIDGGRGP
jgi:hypothetical protein